MPISEKSLSEQKRTRERWYRAQKKLRGMSTDMPETPPASPAHVLTPQRVRGRKQIRKDRSASYRRVQTLKVKLSQSTTKMERYKKKYYRLLKSSQPSPIKMADKIIAEPRKHRAELTAACAALSQLRRSYRRCTRVQDKRRLRNQITFAMAKRVLVKHRLLQLTGMRCKAASKAGNLTPQHGPLVLDFFLRDDNSRNTAGKKDTITRKGLKKQKKFLTDTMKILHAKFLSENPGISLCYSKFCTLRPFWVLLPKAADRETCLCMKHQNVQLMVDALHKVKILSSSDPMVYMNKLFCDPKNKKCVYNECDTCKRMELDGLEKESGDKIVKYYQWQTTSTEDGRKVTKKVEYTSDCFDLYAKLQTELKLRFGKHTYNIMHQYREIRKKRITMKKDEAMVHIDFSENYGCKYGSEVQSAHFGGSKRQVSLHTGICYIGQSRTVTFCSMSDTMTHDPVGIWAHLMPVLEQIMPSTEIHTVHFVSDGPTTQYRNQSNFGLTQVIPFGMGYRNVTWNFLEAGHGKGPADGIGGSIKRSADRFVANGSDITNAATMYRALLTQGTSIRLYLIEDEMFDVPRLQLQKIFTTRIPGTMRIHQLVYQDSSTTVKYRDVSCFCSSDVAVICNCYDLREFQVILTDENENIQPALPDNTDGPHNPIVALSGDLVGQWCCVRYNTEIYPGIIENIDESECEVKTMNIVGKNRFVWPLFDDKIWYGMDDILGIIPEPTNVTARHVQISPQHYEELSKLV